MQHTVELSDDQVRELERLAAEQRVSVDALVQRAVGDYLARRRERAEWGRRWEALVADIRSRMPPDVTPEEIEADITAASEELHAERTAALRAAGDADAGSP